MTPTTTPTLSPSTLALLKPEYQLLNRLYIRNKNQHRVALWWKYISILRRRLRRILEKKLTPEQQNEEVVFLRDRFVENAFVAFSNVVADRAFSPLGAVLLAILSRVWVLLGGKAPAESELKDGGVEVDEGEAIERGVVEDEEEGIGMDIESDGVPITREDMAFGKEEADDDDFDISDTRTPASIEPEPSPELDLQATGDGMDRGFASRPVEVETMEMVEKGPGKKKKRSKDEKEKSKKKKKNKGSGRSKIDDIFAGLL